MSIYLQKIPIIGKEVKDATLIKDTYDVSLEIKFTDGTSYKLNFDDAYGTHHDEVVEAD